MKTLENGSRKTNGAAKEHNEHKAATNTRGAVQQHALGRLDADAQEELGVQQRQLDDLRALK